MPGYVPVQRAYNAGETYAPTLKDIKSEYDAKDGILTVQFHFSMKIKETSDAKKKFKLYDARGEEIVAEVYVADIEDEIVTVEFDIGEEELEQAVVVAVEQGAVMANDDFKVGSANQLLNPAFHVPLNS